MAKWFHINFYNISVVYVALQRVLVLPLRFAIAR